MINIGNLYAIKEDPYIRRAAFYLIEYKQKNTYKTILFNLKGERIDTYGVEHSAYGWHIENECVLMSRDVDLNIKQLPEEFVIKRKMMIF